LDVRLSSFDDASGSLTIALSHRPELSRSPDRLDYHGGVLATLIDVAGHACLAARVGRRVPTIDMRVDFLRPATDRELRATARILRCGRTIGICDIEVVDTQQRILAAGRVTYSTYTDPT
jgi:uncharacterized protein (TIGR00369 family)